MIEVCRRGRRAGATLVCGGQRPADADARPGSFFPPTIFADVDRESKLAREEVFGPVIGFERIADLDDALASANSVEYGLTAAICTTRVGRRSDSPQRSKPAWCASTGRRSAPRSTRRSVA